MHSLCCIGILLSDIFDALYSLFHIITDITGTVYYAGTLYYQTFKP